MNKILILFLFCRVLLIESTEYLGDSSPDSVETQNIVKNAFYLITTPKVWTSSEESVCLVLLRELSLPNGVINVKISPKNSRQIFVQKTQALNSFSQCIQIPINGIRAEKALLTVQLSDIIDETLEIRVRPSNGLTLIETSKPIYRPNERLEFRVITLNDWLRPIEEQFQTISVENSRSMSVMQWTDIKCTNGMIALQMPIAEDNYFGIWKIKVMANNIITEKIFKVIDYEIPNILISMDSPNYIYRSDGQSASTVCVRNSLGHSLKGKLKIFASYVKFDWERINQLQHMTTPYDLSEVEINGCYNLILESNKLLWNSTQYSGRNLKLSFQFIDQTNDFIEEKFFEIPVVTQKFITTFPSVKLMKQYFKPGLPYFGHAMVAQPDYSPAPNQPMTVCYQSREIPWVLQNTYTCEQIASNSYGMVEFTIPPMSNKFKQIEIKVYSTDYPSIESKMVLEPTYSPTDEYMSVEPLINRNHCSDSVEFNVLFNKPIAKQNTKIYYQVIGRGIFHEPKVYEFNHREQWIGENMIVGQNVETTQKFDVLVSKMRVKIPVQSSLNNNLINRILLFYLDSNNNVIADSNVFLTTCADQSMHSTQISLDTEANLASNVNVRLNTRPNSTCSVRVVQNKPYNSLKKINQFVEKFNVRQESSAGDKCEQSFNLKRIQSESSYSPYTAPYGFDSMTSSYEPVISYGDAWDSFNDIGLLVTSNAVLDESPCEWDLYPRDTLSQLSEMRNNQRRDLSKYRVQKVVRNQIQDIERSLFNEVFDWNLVNTDSNTIDRRISHGLISTSGQLYGDTVCVNKDFGITYARNVLEKQTVNDKQFLMSVMSAPKESRIGDTLIYKVYVESTGTQQHNCFPIELEFENSPFYQMYGNPKHSCICGNTTQYISMMLRPKSVGLIDVKIVAKYPIELNSDMISSMCAQRDQTQRFAPQIVIKQLSVSQKGIVSKQMHQKMICNRDNQKKSSEALEMQVLSDRTESTDSTDMIVTNELLEPMFRYVKTRVSANNHNALDSLSAFAASYYLYNYSNNISANWVHKNQLVHELTKTFQSLLTYRHSDGSYSLIKSTRHGRDIGLTTSVFKVLAQSKPYLPFIENGVRVNRLHHTLLWIFEQQAPDGCFPIRSNTRSNVWPLSFDDKYQLTGYVLASLLEAGLDYSSQPLLKAYNCLSDNSNTFLANIQSKPLSAIFYTYIQLLSGNSEESKVWIKALESLNNLDESDLLNEEMLSYLGLSYYLSKDLNNAKRFGERLLHSSSLWRTPISCYAITKLWPLFKHKASTSVKVFGANNQILSTLLFNETDLHHSIVGDKISVPDKGCVLVAKNKLTTHLATESKNFDIKLNGLDTGFVTCNRRRINICVKEKTHISTAHPVVRMQMITGFDLDKKLMKKMIDTEVVTKYKKSGSELMLFLHPMEKSGQSSCFSVPVIQRQELYDQNEAFIKIYDYYNEDLNDVIPYKIPLECQIEQNIH